MPRPKTKSELLEQGQANYDKLLKLVDGFTPEKQAADFPPGTMNRNIRDVLAHLHHWHLMFINWYEVGMSGEKPEMPAKGYSWKTTPELNRWIWDLYQGVSLEESRNMLQESFLTVRTLILKHSDEELFEKKRYKWTGSTSLGAYLVSATSSHYDWAIKLIRRVTK